MLFENLLVSYSGVSRCYWTVSSKFKEKNWTSKLKAKNCDEPAGQVQL